MTETLTLPMHADARRGARIPVAVLGATGSVGQRFVQLLETHPWFRLAEVVASERSAGRSYGDAADWRLDTLLPASAASLEVKPLGAELESRLVFSGLDASVAGEAEDDYANRGGSNGYIVTNPNCSTIGLAMAIAPIERRFGIDQLHVTTMQAISGAGYAGVSSYAILDNVIPYISGEEEEKIETEPRKILGRWESDHFVDAPFRISAQVNRVPTIDGHLMTISLKLRDGGADLDAIRDAIRSFTGEPQRLGLPSAPKQPVHYASEPDRPQPRLDRDRERGMAVTVGRLRPCPLLDIRMVALVHNTIRGAAGAALLNAELLDARGMLRVVDS